MTNTISFDINKSDLNKAQKLVDEYQYHIKKASSLADELAKLDIKFIQSSSH